MTSLLFIAVSFYIFCAYVTLAAPSATSTAVRDDGPSTGGIFGKDSESWAQYTPYYPVGDYVSPPDSCEIVQVNILQRHGARYPTKTAHKAIETALAKIQSVSLYTESNLDFIANFTYDLGEDDLVAFGAQESYDAGEEAYHRYQSLVSADNIPFVRASSKSRVVQSATNWTAGFAEASDQVYVPVLSVTLSESGNDTLDDADCPALSDSTSPATQEDAWIDIYTVNITDYLNTGAPGADLDAADTQALIGLCTYESVANEERSEWCDLFSSLDAYTGFEYWGDLDKYYGTGYGQPLGPVNGVGYINELLARLTDTPVNDSTSTNTTLDSDPATFPLNRTIYADFTHDNLLIAVYAAMGLFPQAAPLNDTQIDTARTWYASKLVPFASRMVVEKLTCGRDSDEYVRIFVNQALQPLEFCGGDENGLCELEQFVESQAYSAGGGDGQWAECFDT